VLVPHTTPIAQVSILALTIAPLAFAAAMNPNFRVAPFSAVLVLLLSGQLGEGPIESAFTRFLEVALGGAIAVVVSLLVFSQRAHSLGLKSAAQILQRMGTVFPKLLAGFSQSSKPDEMLRIQDELGKAVIEFQDLASEAKRERSVALIPEPDPAPLSRTLLRLRHDFVMIGRTAAAPFSDPIAQRLTPFLTQVCRDVSEFLHGSAVSLKAYDAEVNALRTEGLTRRLSTDEVERLFALGFMLEQIHRNLGDLARCVQEWAGPFGVRERTKQRSLERKRISPFKP